MTPTPFFNRSNVRKWCWRVLIGLATLLFGLDATLLNRYSYFSDHGGIQSIDGSVLFYAGMGLMGCLLLVGIAKGMCWLLGVEETYYHDDF